MLAFMVLMTLQSQSLRPIPYYDPLGRMPSNYAQYAACQTSEPFSAKVVSRTAVGDRYTNLVVVFVNASLYQRILGELTIWLNDVAAGGYQTKTIITSGGRAANLRQILQAHRDSGLVGCVMIGDLPVAWWSESSSGEDYPIDLFFEDLTGTFSDANGDGRYDTYNYAGPTIWVGRICASRLTWGNEEQLIRAYFQRNHLYRNGGLMIPRRGLVYNEVDWYPNNHGMNNLYTDITMFNDQNTTTAYHYKNQLRNGYEFVHLIAHSSPWVHTFFLSGDRPGGGSLFNCEVPALAPNAAFYFINGCMCGRYTERDCLCNWYLFAEPWAQAVIASSQLMYGVNDFSAFYRPFGQDSSFGTAFLNWYRSNFSSFMGTLILGDPTLRRNRMTQYAIRYQPVCHQVTPARDWTEYIIDTTRFVNSHPRIGYSQGRIRIVFDSGRIVRSDNYLTSFDGNSFTRPESIAWHEYYDLYSSCCTDAQGRFWVAWQSFRDYPSYDHFQIFSSYYYNNVWSAVQRVGPIAGYHDVQPALASGTDNVVWCAFKSWRNGQGDIWVSSATNGGAWATPTRLTTDSLDQIEPCVVVDGSNHPWVFWASLTNGRWQIQGRTYNNGWQPILALDTIGDNGPPRAARDGLGRIWVVWSKWQGTESDIYYASFDGTNWTPPAPLAQLPGDDLLPDIGAAADGSVWACWQSRAGGSWDIYTAHYDEGWTTPEPVTQDNANDYDPSIIGDADGNIWTTWASDRRGYWNIYAARSPMTSARECPQSTVDLTPELSIAPSLPGAVTTVSFVLPQAGNISLRLYDATGRSVRHITGGSYRPGKHTIRIRLPPLKGVYLLRLESDNSVTTAKLVIG